VGFETRHVSWAGFWGWFLGVARDRPARGVVGWTEHTAFAAPGPRGSATPPRREMIVADSQERWNNAGKV
jgi:hypothetical protein